MLRPKFTKNDIRKYFKAEKERYKLAIEMMLQQIGEQFIADCRNNGNYKDQTGNLRSSVGYVIVKDQKIMYQSFPGTMKDGREKAKAFVNRLLASSPFKGEDSYIFIGVAGMQYAAAVESKSYDVISSSAFTATANIKKGFVRIKNKILSKYQ